ncbi:MBL fold metallo-hydrolase [candidate division KSB1 bacterium]|nr:MAG: MBL fold metallo-hydrolase [candidate division KSB1 bacterium]
MKKIILIAVVLIMTNYNNLLSQQNESSLSITILFDNYIYKSYIKAGWGFSCLVKFNGNTILFDTGNSGESLLYNMKKLDVNIQDIDAVVISHSHYDHTGGLLAFLKEKSDIPVYVPSSFEPELQKKLKGRKINIIPVKKPIKIFKYVYTTGELGDRIKEESLILDTGLGLVVITGCAHPGIVKILKKSKEIIDKDIYLVLGGFHLRDKSSSEIKKIISEFRKIGVLKVGPTHCTGDLAIRMFREEYGENCISLGVGRILKFDEELKKVKTQLNTKTEKEKRNLKSENEERIIKINGKNIVITGSLTIREVEKLTGVPARYILRKLGIPENISKNMNYGRLRKVYNFQIQDVRRYIREYLKSK